MASARATISYTAPPAFLSTDHWKQVHAAFLSQLPLHNLHWKSTSRPTIHTIQELPVDLVAAELIRDEHTSQIPQTVLEKPLLYTYIVVCEDTETYKTIVKRQIKDWHTSASQRKNQEWLIIHIVRPDSKIGANRIFQVKASVLDKIKADFNTDKKDRCVQLVWSSDYDNPTAWAELISKVKEGILSAFDTAVTHREEEVRRSEGQRQMPGWNFCTYFLLKESLASSFEGMNLHEEALETYEALEALFFQVLKEKSLTWFGALITPSSKDDSAPLLSVTKKPYRDLILANSISVFDFRVYLLARQCTLLSNLGRVIDIGHKAVAFLRTFGKRLREIEAQLPAYFVESWTFSSALHVVERCETWSRSLEFTKTMTMNFNAVKGELVELARHQLDILGIDLAFLPSQPPFSNALPKHRAAIDRTLERITKTDLKSALEDKTAFFDLYVALTNRAIELYANAGRRKFALRMHGSLAALDVVRGRIPNALQTYTSLPAHYSPHGWTSLEAFMLTRALDLHAEAQKPQDRDWVMILLEYLKAYVQDMGKSLLITKEDYVAYTSALVKALQESARLLKSDVKHLDHPAISVTVSKRDATLAGTKDGALLDVAVKNALPCPISIDEVTITVGGRESNRLLFSHGETSLPSGNSTLQLFCPSATTGIYSLQSIQVKIAHLHLQWSYGLPVASKNVKPHQNSALVRVPQDIHALDVQLRQPQLIRLEQGIPPKTVLVLKTGRNDVSKAMMRVSSPGGPRFLTEDAQIEGEDDITFEIIDGSIVFFDIKSQRSIRILIPHTDVGGYGMRVDVVVDYATVEEPSLTRTIRLTRMVPTALPLAINVEDFFRGTRLFTRFTLTSTTHQYVRVKATELRSTKEDDAIVINRGLSSNPGTVTITPAQPGNFLFQVDAKRGQAKNPLSLHIRYRMLREEVESFIRYAVQQVLSDALSTSLDSSTLISELVQTLEGDASWVELYGITGELVVPELSHPNEELNKALERTVEILKQGRPPEIEDGHWREIVIPVDVPQVHILAAIRLQILPNPFSSSKASDKLPPLYAGQPIAATLAVTTSFHWSPNEDNHNNSYAMRFDVEEMTKDWLVSGRKRGDLVARDGQTFCTPITLIALHHGELALPKVLVTALPLVGEMKMGSVVVPSCEIYQMHGAEKVLVLPRGGRTTFVVNMGENEGEY